jgi:hypothetical protein
VTGRVDPFLDVLAHCRPCAHGDVDDVLDPERAAEFHR